MSVNEMESVNQNAREHQARDPVCGMLVDPQKAAFSYEYRGQTYFFCSAGCLKKFRYDPDRFLDVRPETSIEIESAAPKKSKADEYTCPMHPDVRESKPGGCPKCGMGLEPVTAAAPEEKIEYTCPMHPEIVRDGPGACPICGMALEPRVATGEEENAELISMQRRFWLSVSLTLPLLLLAMSEFIPGDPVRTLFAPVVVAWISLAL